MPFRLLLYWIKISWLTKYLKPENRGILDIKNFTNTFYTWFLRLRRLLAFSGILSFLIPQRVYIHIVRWTQVKILSNTSYKGFNDIEITPFKDDASGAFCISIDFELAWGSRFAKIDSPFATLIARMSRRNIPYLIEAFEKYSIPVTWAILGHLFLSHCERDQSGLAHPEMPGPKFHSNRYWTYERGDWYQHDPCGTVDSAPWWFAPDLIHLILKSNVKKEIGIHSFSHIDFSSCDEDLALAELERCKEVINNYNLTPRSIVFPGNLTGHLNALPKIGIIAFRGFDFENGVRYPSRIDEGLWDIHQSMQLVANGREDEYVQRAKYLINCAIANNVAFHLCLHPYEVDKKMVSRVLVPILEYADKLRKSGKLWIATMKEIANYCETREKSVLNVVPYGSEIRIDVRGDDMDTQRFTYPEISLKMRETNKKIVINGRSLEEYEYRRKNGFLVVIIPVKCDPQY